MVYRLSSMEVWKRRNKPSKPCIEELGDDDKLVMQNVVDEIGCKPPYLSSTKSSNTCTSISDLRRGYGMLVRVLQLDPTNYPPPCQIIHNLIIDFEEYDLAIDAKGDPFFVVESYARRFNVPQKYFAKLSPHFLHNHIIVGSPFTLGKPPNAANPNVEGER